MVKEACNLDVMLLSKGVKLFLNSFPMLTVPHSLHEERAESVVIVVIGYRFVGYLIFISVIRRWSFAHKSSAKIKGVLQFLWENFFVPLQLCRDIKVIDFVL
jgi:hypothetical protein